MTITEVMQQVADEVRRRQASRGGSASNGGAAPGPSVLPPAPPRLYVTPLKEGGIERFSELEQRARQKTEVSRRVPKFLRRLFRKQGGFNKDILEVVKFLMKENREANKRLREIITYLRAENGWFDGVMNASSHVERELHHRLQNEHSFEGRLLALDGKVAGVRSEALKGQQRQREDISVLSSQLNDEHDALRKLEVELIASKDSLSSEAKAREALKMQLRESERRLEAFSHSSKLFSAKIAGEARAREAFEDRVKRQSRGWEGLSKILATVRETLAGEAKAREAVEERVKGQQGELDGVSQDLDAVREALAGEAKAREAVAERVKGQQGELEGFSQNLDAVGEALAGEARAHETAQIQLEALQTRLDGLSSLLETMREAQGGETRAREAVEERINGQHGRLDTLSNILAAVREAVFGEAKAREAVVERVNGQHARLDAFLNTLESLQQGLAAEVRARENLGGRFDKDRPIITALTNSVNEASEAVRVFRTENDRLHQDLQDAKAVLRSMQDGLIKLEEQQIAEASYLKRELHLHSQSLATLHTSTRSAPGRKGAKVLPASTNAIDKHQFDSFYIAFENEFRGSRADIKQRVHVYIPLIKQARGGKRRTPVLDLGCGRGEWLELLHDEGLIGRGIDLNEFMVAECVERKLEVTQADVIEHLSTLPSDSHGAITAFQVIEHLPFPILVKLFAESLRVLRPGGICIFETPNPDNVQVGSNRFYSDPTHVHPLPSGFTKFVMATTGFKRLEVLPLHPDANDVAMTEEPAPIERFSHQLFFGAQDYAVIGRK